MTTTPPRLTPTSPPPPGGGAPFCISMEALQAWLGVTGEHFEVHAGAAPILPGRMVMAVVLEAVRCAGGPAVTDDAGRVQLDFLRPLWPGQAFGVDPPLADLARTGSPLSGRVVDAQGRVCVVFRVAATQAGVTP